MAANPILKKSTLTKRSSPLSNLLKSRTKLSVSITIPTPASIDHTKSDEASQSENSPDPLKNAFGRKFGLALLRRATVTEKALREESEVE